MIFVLAAIILAIVFMHVAATQTTRNWTDADWDRAYAHQAEVARMNDQLYPWLAERS